MEELLDEGIARNVLTITTVTATARRRFSGAIHFDAAPLMAVAAVVVPCTVVEVRHVDLDELAMAGGLVAPLVLVVGIAGEALIVRRGVGCGL